MKRVKALLFDLGGVIVNLDYHKTINAFDALGVANTESLYNQFNQTEIFDGFETGSLTGKEFINLMKISL